MTYRSGSFIAQYINDGELDDKQIQPNGVDLKVGELKKVITPARLGDDDYFKGERKEARVKHIEGKYHYTVDSLNPYIVEYAEVIEIPDNHIGFVYPRSRVMRCGAWLSTAVWDAGYRGKGEGGLLPFNDLEIETDMRIAQIVFAKTEELEQQYDGQHDGENL